MSGASRWITTSAVVASRPFTNRVCRLGRVQIRTSMSVARWWLTTSLLIALIFTGPFSCFLNLRPAQASAAVKSVACFTVSLELVLMADKDILSVHLL